MRAGWKNDPVARAYFEIKREIQRRDSMVAKERAMQIEALDHVAAELLRQAELTATRDLRHTSKH